MKKVRVSIPAAVILILMSASLTFSITFLWFMNYTEKGLTNIYEKEQMYSKLTEVDALVKKYYISDLDPKKVEDGIVQGYLYGIGEKYGGYLNEENYTARQTSSEGKFVGIGVNVSVENGTQNIVITNIMKNSPAEREKVQKGDIIIKVEGESCEDIGYYVALDKMLGEEGTKANFTVRRTSNGVSSEINYTLAREKFDRIIVEYEVLENNLGYVSISGFEGNVVNEFELAIDNLMVKGVKGIIFDVRDNSGGDLKNILKVLDKLLPQGPIVRIQNKQGEERVYDSDKNFTDVPMVVITNESSASAAELFTAALKEYNKAYQVGKTTYGKGSVVTTFPLKDKKTAVILTTEYYLPPFGENFEGKGVVPDYDVEFSAKDKPFYEVTRAEDLQFNKAVEVLKEEIANPKLKFKVSPTTKTGTPTPTAVNTPTSAETTVTAAPTTVTPVVVTPAAPATKK